jgi:hypothetical protein
MNRSQFARLVDYLRFRFDEGASLIDLNRIIDKLSIGEEEQGALRYCVWELANERERPAPPFAQSPQPSERTATAPSAPRPEELSLHAPRRFRRKKGDSNAA